MDTGIPPRVHVKSTLPELPLLGNSERPHIKTERLILRPFSQADLEPLHSLCIQPEVMKFTSSGRVNFELAETQKRLNQSLAPNDTRVYDFAVCLASTGEFIGSIGVHTIGGSYTGWPEVGYMLKKEHWGRGYASEALRAVLEGWWKLPRRIAEVEVDTLAVDEPSNSLLPLVPEMLSAVVDTCNPASMKVMSKSGFRNIRVCREDDDREGSEGKVELAYFVLSSEEGH